MTLKFFCRTSASRARTQLIRDVRRRVFAALRKQDQPRHASSSPAPQPAEHCELQSGALADARATEMDRTRNDSQDTWRGASGAEDIEVLHGRSPHASKRWLGAGLLIGAVLLCGVVFVSVPNPKAINSVHGGAIRCVDNTACVGMGLVGDCCPDAHGQSQSCCHDPLNVATVTTTRRGACDDNSACAALKLQGACCPDTSGNFLGCCKSSNNTVRAPHAVAASCAKNTACRAIGLTGGDCCPTDDGTMLGCCPPIQSKLR